MPVMPQNITLHDRTFEPFLPAAEIAKAVAAVAGKLNREYAGKEPVFLGVLNGAFMFAADLFKHLAFPCHITFVKLSSYQGTQSTGQVQQLLGLTSSLQGKDVIVLEDIVDTGRTVQEIRRLLAEQKPASLAIATAFDKPTCRQCEAKADYVGLELPDAFVVGYGLDYNGLGRNYPCLYKTIE
jgi:hypoxanthine phosphoribosyltransferase